MAARYFTLLITVFLAVSLLCSCSDEDTIIEPEIPVDSGYYATRAELMQAFLTAYEEMDAVTLGDMLHPDFRMLLSPATQVEFPGLGQALDRDQEMTIAKHMFSGAAGTDAAGQFVAPIGSIDVLLLEQQSDWVDSDPDGEFPNTTRALFAVRVMFTRPAFWTIDVTGSVVFFTAGKDTVVGGTNQTYWNLIGQQDFTGFRLKAIETVSWGSVKALYR